MAKSKDNWVTMRLASTLVFYIEKESSTHEKPGDPLSRVTSGSVEKIFNKLSTVSLIASV
jgi:hypothetical protein